MSSLTVIILTKNSENEVVNRIENVLFAQNILIIDDNSQDRAVEVIRNMNNPKVEVSVHALNGNFSAQRNFALQKVNTDWALFIDIDEHVSDGLKKEIFSSIQDVRYNGFFIRRVDLMWGKKLKHGEVGNISLLRLGRVGFGKWKGKVHEKWMIKGSTASLDNELLHYPHPKISEFLEEVSAYSTLRAQELQSRGVKVSILQIIMYPGVKFILNYILKRGYKDGLVGFLVAMMMSFHSFLVRAKLYLLQQHSQK